MAKQGTIRKLLETYGFIKSDDGGDLFFHQTAVQGGDFRDLRVGQAVEFDVEVDRKTNRERAVNVKPRP